MVERDPDLAMKDLTVFVFRKSSSCLLSAERLPFDTLALISAKVEGIKLVSCISTAQFW